MDKHNQRAEDKQDQKRRRRAKPMAAELTHDQTGLAEPIELPGGPIAAAGDGTIQAQAGRLGDTRLQTAQRQALAAQIGRVQGNRHLQRVVVALKRDENAVLDQSNSPSVSRTAIQRDPDGEFIPRISAHPTAATVKIGDDHFQAYQLDNIDEAPRGTTFQWGGGIREITEALGEQPPIEYLGQDSEDRRAAIVVFAQAPGGAVIEGSLAHEVPGGPWTETFGPMVPITVPTPTILETSLRRESASGEVIEGDPMRMSVGEYFVVRVRLGNVSTRGENYTMAVMTGGDGYGTVLGQEDVRRVGPNVYEVKYPANAIGTANLEIQVAPGGTATEQAPSTSVTACVEMDRQRFINRCIPTTALVMRLYAMAAGWANRVAVRYGQAWDAHENTLKAEDASQRLVGDLIINAALAFIVGGAGGAVGRMLENFAKPNVTRAFLAGGVTDLVKHTIQRGGQGTVPGSAAAFRAFPQKPSDWQNLTEARINDEKAEAAELVEYWSLQAIDNPGFTTDFDPYASMQEAIRIAGQRPEELETPDEQLAYQFEKGFWKSWIENYSYYIQETPIGCAGTRISYSVETRIEGVITGRKIRRRLQWLAGRLGEDADTWISEWSTGLRQRLEAAVRSRREQERH